MTTLVAGGDPIAIDERTLGLGTTVIRVRCERDATSSRTILRAEISRISYSSTYG